MTVLAAPAALVVVAVLADGGFRRTRRLSSARALRLKTADGTAAAQARTGPRPHLALVRLLRQLGDPVIASLRSASAERRFERALPDALDVVAGALRSGRPLASALGEAAAGAPPLLAADLQDVARRVRQGATVDAALAAWTLRRRNLSVNLAVAGWRLALEVGGAQATVLAGLADSVRDRAASQDDLWAAASQARASAAVLAVAPVGFALFSGVVDPATLVATLRQPLTASCLAAGVVLDAIGACWMLRMARGASSPDGSSQANRGLASRWRPVLFRRLPQPSTALGRFLRSRAGRSPDPLTDRLVGRSVAVVALAGLLGSPLLALFCLWGSVVWWWLGCRARRRRAEQAVIDALPDVVDLFRAAWAAGCTPPEALEAVGRYAPEAVRPALQQAVAAHRRGSSLAAALAALPESLGDPSRRLVADLSLSLREGTPLIETLGRAAEDTRRARRRQAEAKARKLPVELLFPLVICVLPAFALLTVVPLLVTSLQSLRP